MERYIAPVSIYRYPNFCASNLAVVLLPAPAKPSIAIIIFFDILQQFNKYFPEFKKNSACFLPLFVKISVLIFDSSINHCKNIDTMIYFLLMKTLSVLSSPIKMLYKIFEIVLTGQNRCNKNPTEL